MAVRQRDAKGRFLGTGGAKPGDFTITFDRAAEKKLLAAGPIALTRVAEAITKQAKVHPPSPVLTGTNRRSIDWDAPSPNVRRVFTQSGYGAFLEFGTKKMAAQPYMKPAFDLVRGSVDKIIAQVRRETSG